MRRYQTSEMRNVIKYRSNVVLCLVVALAFAMKFSKKINRNTYGLYSFTSAVNNHSSGWLNLKNILPFASFSKLMLFLANILSFKLKTLLNVIARHIKQQIGILRLKYAAGK